MAALAPSLMVAAALMLGAAASPAPREPELRGIQLAKARWGMSRTQVRQAIGVQGDVPFTQYSHLPASWQQLRAPARLGALRGYLYFWLAGSAGLQLLAFRPDEPARGRCERDLAAARDTLTQDFGPALERREATRHCFEWSPAAGGSLRACCSPLVAQEWPPTRLAHLDVLYLGPERPGVEPIPGPTP